MKYLLLDKVDVWNGYQWLTGYEIVEKHHLPYSKLIEYRVANGLTGKVLTVFGNEIRPRAKIKVPAKLPSLMPLAA